MKRAVVVTGASSGIGAETAQLLATRGFAVFAGVRNDEDSRRAELHSGVRAVRLDVTDRDSLERAASEVASSGFPFAGLVNNAGIALGGPLEALPIDELRRQFETNVFGALAATQAFAPLARAERGRIVFVGSISGRLAIPFIAPYSTSKFALRAMTDALRGELRPWGIAISLIEPGSVRTPIWKKGRDTRARLEERLTPEARTLYRPALDALYRQVDLEEEGGMAASRVAEAIFRALTSRRPRARYLVGASARAGSIVALLPAPLRDRIMRRSMRLP